MFKDVDLKHYPLWLVGGFWEVWWWQWQWLLFLLLWVRGIFVWLFVTYVCIFLLCVFCYSYGCLCVCFCVCVFSFFLSFFSPVMGGGMAFLCCYRGSLKSLYYWILTYNTNYALGRTVSGCWIWCSHHALASSSFKKKNPTQIIVSLSSSKVLFFGYIVFPQNICTYLYVLHLFLNFDILLGVKFNPVLVLLCWFFGCRWQSHSVILFWDGVEWRLIIQTLENQLYKLNPLLSKCFSLQTLDHLLGLSNR